MEFGSTYRSILGHDLRNIYAGNTYSRAKRQPKLPVIPPKSHSHKVAAKKKQREFEYNYKYHSYVPRAPAFDMLSPKSIAKMVERMYRPKSSYSHGKHGGQGTHGLSLDRSVTSITAADITYSSERLASQQTVSTEVRRCLTKSMRAKSPAPDIRLSCPRMTMSISQRYYPRCYKRWYVDEEL